MEQEETLSGGIVNGVHLDPVSFILARLRRRPVRMDEGAWLAAITEFIGFTRLPGESVNSVLVRYETVRNRALAEGNFQVPVEG